MPYPQFIVAMKADLSLDDVIDFVNMMTEQGEKKFRRLYVALPFTRLKEMGKKYADSGLIFGAMQMNRADEGAFTTPIAAKMIKDAGGQFVLIGTQDERQHPKMDAVKLQNKLSSALKEGLRPFFSVGSKIEHTEEELIQLLQPLKRSNLVGSNLVASDPHPVLIYELPFTTFKSYLPTSEELTHFKDLIQSALKKVFEQDAEKVKVIATLPSDLIGFSSLFETFPFDGAFFIKSGIYPHAVHQETAKLFHVHCEEKGDST